MRETQPISFTDFDALWRRVTGLSGATRLAALHAAYGETHRAYHNLEHVIACLRGLDEAYLVLADKPYAWDAVAVGLWYHDAIYRIGSGTNERDSADWAARDLRADGADPVFADQVHAWITATEHQAEPEGRDAQLLVDLDLGILGCPTEIYDRFETAIRQEYRRVPGFIYRRKRAEILRGFLARPAIYHTPHLHQAWEQQARENLARAIEALVG
ncbi:HD domain-containing protein [Acanthopleuribacter pedis]|uniref:Metal-dependent HD superfamily phosphohydrolase n=1 Tax=Acanthopleuribacter pedis TaxID=442870 RepID=A0A8J7QIU3_9BACT|nr:hypothetical protein [Acanthopleuribacter pedis]MBO1321566.1 hypothetical protein [Acanthopleuribacter pedis]